MNNNRFLTTVILLFCFSLSFSQSNEKKIMKEVLNTLLSLPKEINSNKTNLVKLKYSVQSVTKQGERSLEYTSFYKRGKSLYFKTKKASYYVDEKDLFLIIPKEKIVIHRNIELQDTQKSEKKKFNHVQYQNMVTFQTLLVQDAKVNSMQKLKEGERELIKIVFTPNSDVKAFDKIRQVHIWFDQKKKEIVRIWTHYDHSFKLKEMIVSYEEINFNSKEKELKKPVAKYVLTNSNRLLKQYSGYRLIEE